MTKTIQEEKIELIKEIVDILLDYKLNSTKVMTTEQTARHIIKQATLSKRKKMIKEFINELRKIKDTTRDVDNWIEIDNLIKKYEQEIKNG
jgi:hypothetical protein